MSRNAAHIFSARYPTKRAFITGAASGLGYALCKELSADGWTIGMADINAVELELKATEIVQIGGVANTYQLDVADKHAYRTVVDDFINRHGGIDLLVNNAGVGDAGRVDEYGLENWDWLLRINLNGVIYGSALFIPIMRAQGKGTIINIASAAAFTSLPRMGAYNVSKAAVLSLSETMSAELHGHGVHVSVVMPTFFKTNVMSNSRGSEEDIEMSRLIFATTSKTPEHIASMVLRQAGEGKFHIILNWDAHLMYRLKRYFPRLILWLFQKGEHHRDIMGDRLKNRYKRMDSQGKVDHDYLKRVFDK
jgi:NADP-dependent 3-hydroxy acid dehydrogenase YdfG